MARMVDADALSKLVGEPIEVFLRRLDLKLPPIVDAEPVVRCKDCIHRFKDGKNVMFNCCELNHNKAQADDWFCADGERREDADK